MARRAPIADTRACQTCRRYSWPPPPRNASATAKATRRAARFCSRPRPPSPLCSPRTRSLCCPRSASSPLTTPSRPRACMGVHLHVHPEQPTDPAHTAPCSGRADRASRLLARPETTVDVQEAVKDLKVLGRKDFKLLLKWRLQMRKLLTAQVRRRHRLQDARPARLRWVSPTLIRRLPGETTEVSSRSAKPRASLRSRARMRRRHRPAQTSAWTRTVMMQTGKTVQSMSRFARESHRSRPWNAQSSGDPHRPGLAVRASAWPSTSDRPNAG